MGFENPDQIKLIVVDMDGTLLNSKGELPKGIFDIINLLYDHGVKFTVATGRQYWNIRDLLRPVIHKIAVLADNGAVTFDEDVASGEILLPPSRVKEYIKACKRLIPQGAYPILCGVKKAYLDTPNDELLINCNKYYRRFEMVENLLNVRDDAFIKIAVYDSKYAGENAYPALAVFSNEIQVKVSGEDWVDLNELHCNKGTAVEILQAKMGITSENTMVFGDFLNDVEMMKDAKFSYAMKNAHPDLKALARFEAPSNDDNGVIRIINERFYLLDG